MLLNGDLCTASCVKVRNLFCAGLVSLPQLKVLLGIRIALVLVCAAGVSAFYAVPQGRSED